MLILHVPDALQYTSANGVAQILRRRIGVDIAEINGPIHPRTTCCSTRAGSHHGVDVGRREPARGSRAVPKRGKDGSLRGDECLGLLRLGNVCAAVFTIVDVFSVPSGFGWEGVDDLSRGEQEGRTNK